MSAEWEVTTAAGADLVEWLLLQAVNGNCRPMTVVVICELVARLQSVKRTIFRPLVQY